MTRSIRARLGAALLGLAIVLPIAGAAPATAAAADFPAGHTGYHTYAEMSADVLAVATAHPDIVKRISIGTSYEGRTIWAVKISDNVDVDENEPEVLFDGLTHADEHMGLEMTLHIMHWLVDGYGVWSRITNLVNSREIWIILAVNPDGAEYDIKYGKFHYWRKNRQPTPGTSYIGTDLNRNFGYRWGIVEGRTSTNPAAITYMGPKAFSAPETRNVRDFLASRVVNGRQQIRTAITFHEAGRLVMWPYGYTMTDIPSDMTVDDHRALEIIGRHMASTNGYHPEQASDLYLTSGTTRDYEYGTYRIFSYTFEMSVVDYPSDSMIAPETGRNREAVLYLIERAACPLAVLGATVRIARCGAFDDDFEVSRGWARNLDGTDTATGGLWSRTAPQPTSTSAGRKQAGGVTSGRYGLVTGGAAGTNANANDVDGGTTSVTSPTIRLPAAAGQKLQFRYSFAHDATATYGDRLVVEVIDVDAATATAVFTAYGAPVERNASWKLGSVDLSAFAGKTIRIRIAATDAGTNGIVEAAVDDVRVTQPQ
ncbi:MAG TPA: M14 family zinc carboxypeptidase [Candidatus Limnocylindrales bacterium]|nr:M14 family zinc carboxypeptidase [Candidatus Limnocylindrales bacterium]